MNHKSVLGFLSMRLIISQAQPDERTGSMGEKRWLDFWCAFRCWWSSSELMAACLSHECDLEELISCCWRTELEDFRLRTPLKTLAVSNTVSIQSANRSLVTTRQITQNVSPIANTLVSGVIHQDSQITNSSHGCSRIYVFLWSWMSELSEGTVKGFSIASTVQLKQEICKRSACFQTSFSFFSLQDGRIRFMTSYSISPVPPANCSVRTWPLCTVCMLTTTRPWNL